jgi:hypothetical protein
VSEAHENKAVILTPDRRLRVFVSSPLDELADERRAVARAISALRLTPVMFEQGARPHAPPDVYRAYLARSEVFIGLYWQQYGQAPPGADISGLEEEFDLSGSLPKLLYVKEPAPAPSAGPLNWASWCVMTSRRCRATGSPPLAFRRAPRRASGAVLARCR